MSTNWERHQRFYEAVPYVNVKGTAYTITQDDKSTDAAHERVTKLRAVAEEVTGKALTPVKRQAGFVV